MPYISQYLIMTEKPKRWPSVPSSSRTTTQGSGQTGDRAEGAKNLWGRQPFKTTNDQ